MREGVCGFPPAPRVSTIGIDDVHDFTSPGLIVVTGHEFPFSLYRCSEIDIVMVGEEQDMMAGFEFAPRGFALANGGLLPISQNSALFSLFGTAYGGNGTTSFALPNLQGRTPVGIGTSADSSWNPTPFVLGEFGGSESVTLSLDQLPTHGRTADARHSGSPALR